MRTLMNGDRKMKRGRKVFDDKILYSFSKLEMNIMKLIYNSEDGMKYNELWAKSGIKNRDLNEILERMKKKGYIVEKGRKYCLTELGEHLVMKNVKYILVEVNEELVDDVLDKIKGINGIVWAGKI